MITKNLESKFETVTNSDLTFGISYCPFGTDLYSGYIKLHILKN